MRDRPFPWRYHRAAIAARLVVAFANGLVPFDSPATRQVAEYVSRA